MIKINSGGLTMQNAEPLDQQWQKIMNESSDNGVVIFSMGSIASTKDMPMEMKVSVQYVEASHSYQ